MNRGPWGGILTTLVVSKLLGCSYYITRKKLKQLEQAVDYQQRLVDLEDIGQLIYEYRKEQMELEEEAVIGRYFGNPVVRM